LWKNKSSCNSGRMTAPAMLHTVLGWRPPNRLSAYHHVTLVRSPGGLQVFKEYGGVVECLDPLGQRATLREVGFTDRFVRERREARRFCT
jgi:hypothetical protein